MPRNKHLLYLPFCYSLLLLAQTVLAAPEQVAYTLDEPVFQGQAYVIEAGRDHQELVVLVHGLGDRAADTWRDILPRLATQFHVVAFDLPGFGRSTHANALYSPDNYAAFIDFLVNKLGHQRFMLIGHSMGGNIALRYASLYPDKVKRLMLVDAAGILHRITYTNFLAHYGIRLLPQFYPAQTADMQAIAAMLLGQLAAQYDTVQLGEQMLLSNPDLRQAVFGGEPMAIAAYAMMMTDFSDRLAHIAVPTLIIWGKQDNVTPLRAGKILATSMPNAGLVVFDDTGHAPMSARPERFMTWLQRFAGSDDAQFRQILATTRYQLDAPAVNTSERIVHCKNQDRQLYVGDFKLMIIENCQHVEIDSARIGSLTIRNSDVTINNCLIESTGKALLIENANVEINGCRIRGTPALAFNNAQLDIAGSSLSSAEGPALVNLTTQAAPSTKPPRPAAWDRIVPDDTILFSLTRINSKYNNNRQLHGPVVIAPNQAW